VPGPGERLTPRSRRTAKVGDGCPSGSLGYRKRSVSVGCGRNLESPAGFVNESSAPAHGPWTWEDSPQNAGRTAFAAALRHGYPPFRSQAGALCTRSTISSPPFWRQNEASSRAGCLLGRQVVFPGAECADCGGARVAWAAADNALQIHGGNGFALEYRVSRILCDARILNIFEGAAEIQAQVIARRLLG